MALSISLLVLLALVTKPSLQQNCYFPNGVIARNDYPCTDLTNNDPGIQIHCCEVGRTCLPNRMCSGNDKDPNPMRGTCTDSTWNSPNCPKFCTPYSRLGKMYNCTSTAGVLEDDDVAFCCVDSGPNCCNNQSQIFVANDWDFAASAALVVETSKAKPSLAVSTVTKVSDTASSSLSTTGLSFLSSSAALSPAVPESTIGISSVATTAESDKDAPSTTIPTLAAATASTATAGAPGPKRDWTGISIGAGVGAAIPLLALIVVGTLLWRRHRRRRTLLGSPVMSGFTRDSALTGTTKESLVRSVKPEHLKGYELGHVHTYELDSVRERTELPLKSPRELPGSEGERQRHQAFQPRDVDNPYQPA